MKLMMSVNPFFFRAMRGGILILLTVLSTACGAGGSIPETVSIVESDYAAAPAEPAQAVDNNQAQGGEDGDIPLQTLQTETDIQAQETRVIIYTGDVALVVKDTQESIEAITAMTNAQGGFVAGSNVYQAGEVLRGSITIRVPAQNYQATLAQLRDMALRVEHENSSSQDVTEEFVDLQARKTNLEFTEQALQELLEERKRLGSTSDILEVHRELTNIRGQIEQIEGRLRYLTNQAALSTITVTLTPDVLYQPVSVGGWEPQGVAKEALQTLVAALQILGNIVIWLLIFVLPLLVIVFMPLVVLALIIRWAWRQKKSKKPASEESEE